MLAQLRESSPLPIPELCLLPRRNEWEITLLYFIKKLSHLVTGPLKEFEVWVWTIKEFEAWVWTIFFLIAFCIRDGEHGRFNPISGALHSVG